MYNDNAKILYKNLLNHFTKNKTIDLEYIDKTKGHFMSYVRATLYKEMSLH